MGRDGSDSEDMGQKDEGQKAGLLTTTIEPEDAADAQSRQRLIGHELRRWFDNIVKEPVPDELLALLREIDRRKS